MSESDLLEVEQTTDGEGSLSSTASSTRLLENQSHEFYGFVVYLLSSVFLVGYIAWAALPDTTLHHLGITYYCSKYDRIFGLVLMIN
jgi:phosphatidylinositol glycan class P protein